MSSQDITALNHAFGVADRIVFKPIQGGLPAVEFRSAQAAGLVALHGAHIMAFQPVDAAPVLWMSRCSRFEPLAPIRGGIPVCWPWFGSPPTDADLPSHGFARLLSWDVIRAATLDEDATEIEFGLADSPASMAMWPHRFEARLRVRVGRQLDLELSLLNTDASAWSCTAALHTYFAVSNVATVRVRGLEHVPFIDTVPTPHTRGVEDHPIAIRAETDRVYLDTEADCLIEDPGLARRIRIAKSGSCSTVVWNPWIAKAIRMPDFGDEEYPGMLCLETANAGTDARCLPPGGRHAIGATLSVEPL